VAGVLTGERSGAAVRDVAGALMGLRRSLAANAPGGSGTVQLFRILGLGLAVATLLLGLVRFDDPDPEAEARAQLADDVAQRAWKEGHRSGVDAALASSAESR
jgi:hypothetical protein